MPETAPQPRYADKYFEAWLKNNWKEVHNVAEFIQDIASTGWSAANNLVEVPKEDRFWYFIEKAQQAAALFTGGPTPPSGLEEQFPISTRRCTCARQGGQLVGELDAGLGANAENLFGSSWEAKEILDVYSEGEASFCKYRKVDGQEKTEFIAKLDIYESFDVEWYIRPQPGTVCCGDVVDPPPKPPLPPYVYFDPTHPDNVDKDCQVEVRWKDTYIDKYGLAMNKYLVVDRCRGEVYCYWESVEGPVFNRNGYGGQKCDNFPPPHPPVPVCPEGLTDDGLSAVQYRIDAGCSWNPETEEYEQQYFYDVEEQADSFLGLARRMDALAWMINTSGLIPYRVCNAKPKLEGDWVTTQWISEEPSRDSTLRLRKRIRFRSKQSRQYSDLLEHFRDFTWEAGPVCVIHKGAWWGTPQVWARDADEGKRVIRHVAGVAGIDPDQVGQWEVSGSRNPRFGRRGKMRLRELEGMPWITARDGSNMLPMGDVEP